MAVSSKHTGWRRDVDNARVDMYYQGTRVGHISATGIASAAAISATTTIAATTTITAGTGLTVTTGNSVVTAGDLRITAGNERLGAVSTFATTEPTSALVMKVGTAPVGAITTSGGIFTDGTNVMKIIAAGTANNVET